MSLKKSQASLWARAWAGQYHRYSDRFLGDLAPIVASMPAGYDPDTAGNVVVRELGGRLRNAPLEEIAPLRT